MSGCDSDVTRLGLQRRRKYRASGREPQDRTERPKAKGPAQRPSIKRWRRMCRLIFACAQVPKCTNRSSASTPSPLHRLTGHLDGAMPCANRDAACVGGVAFPSVQLCDETTRLPGGCRDFHLSLRIVNLADVSKLRIAVGELRHLHGSGRAYREALTRLSSVSLPHLLAWHRIPRAPPPPPIPHIRFPGCATPRAGL